MKYWKDTLQSSKVGAMKEIRIEDRNSIINQIMDILNQFAAYFWLDRYNELRKVTLQASIVVQA